MSGKQKAISLNISLGCNNTQVPGSDFSNEIVVDMTPKKGQYTSGQVYVAFSRVRELNKLHIINYTCEQIRVSEHVAAEMNRLRGKPVPSIPEIHVPVNPSCVSILHINVGGLKAKIKDVRQEHLFKKLTSFHSMKCTCHTMHLFHVNY